MLSKLLFAALLAVIAYKAFGWWRAWQARRELVASTPPPLGPGEDLRRCARCDRYVAGPAVAVCAQAECPLKGQ